MCGADISASTRFAGRCDRYRRHANASEQHQSRISAPSECPNCGVGQSLEAHGYYWRWISEAFCGKVFGSYPFARGFEVLVRPETRSQYLYSEAHRSGQSSLLSAPSTLPKRISDWFAGRVLPSLSAGLKRQDVPGGREIRTGKGGSNYPTYLLQEGSRRKRG